MIAVDTNILVYAHRSSMPQHDLARRRVQALASGDAAWAIPVFCVGELIRILTHVRLWTEPFAPDEACEAVSRLVRSPSCTVLMPGERYWPLLRQAIEESGARGNLTFDAQIVALCRESGVRALLTEDRDFARFGDFQTQRL